VTRWRAVRTAAVAAGLALALAAGELLARIDRGEGARLIRLGMALDTLPHVKALSCPRR
jgi:hypothetical protein